MEAPTFTTMSDGRRYPNDGERLGPAWNLAWAKLMEDPESWVSSRTLAGVMASAGIQEKTAKGVLAAARRYGVLAVRYKRTETRCGQVAEYRPVPSLIVH